MKRLLILAIVMGGFYLTMTGFSSAEQKPKIPVAQVRDVDRQDSDYRDYDRNDLKTGLVRAFYDALGAAENDLNENGDIENNELGNNVRDNRGLIQRQKYIGPDGKEHTAFEEARRTIYQADRILARIKAENRVAMQKLRNPPRRILPGQVQPPKVKKISDEQALKLKIEAQEKQVQQQQQKLQSLKEQLVNRTEKQ
ncbi:hypothetical protein [Gimesia algae]|uniref:Uncharacterized protein n=1 Tax=Gimesia algae TaxID=2527971 RepID=A0A517V976_9PLAN|nr:hypothetical protein [Gimesia algae]QDT89555.1 hypothetical protein Pan161_11850 [Gimesia algae]